MKNFFEIRHGVAAHIEQSRVLAGKAGYDMSVQALKEIGEAFEKKEMMVVAVGEARRGKSSLLNAFLNEKEPLFPVDVNVCTNVVTIVRYGKTEKAEVFLEDPQTGEVKTEQISRAQIAEYVSEQGNPNNYKNVKLLNLAVPNDLLKEGVVFVDTPGVGSLNVSHAEATYGFLPGADLILFVSDCGNGLMETELNFLKRGYQYCKNIIFPLTKKDMNADYQVIAEDNRKKIHQLLDIPEEAVQLIPVSSVAKQRYLKSGSKSMYTNSNFPQLEEAIWTMIARTRAEILIEPYLQAARQELMKMADSVAAQYQLLNTDKGKTEELIQSLNSEIAKMEDFQKKSADWRNQINYFFSVTGNNMHDRIQKISAQARELLDEKVMEKNKKICEQSEYSAVLGQINEIISCGALDIREELEGAIRGKSDEMEASLGLDLDINQSALEALRFEPDEDLVVVFPKKKKMDRVIGGGRKISINSMGGAAVGAILGGAIGMLVGGPPGLLLGVQIGSGAGTLVGGTKGCVEALGKYDELDVGRVSKALQQYIASSISALNTTINNTIAQLRMCVVTSFEEKIRRRIRELQENAAQMKKNIQLSKTEVPKKLNLLKQQDELLQKQIADSDRLHAWLEELQEAGGSAQAGKAGQSGRREEPVKASAAESGADAEYQFL